jgi:hypothetical protein
VPSRKVTVVMTPARGGLRIDRERRSALQAGDLR